MAQNIDSKVRAKVWLTLDQVDALRSACYSTGADYLQQRNEAIIALMYDTGLRVGELVAIDVDMLREGNTALYLPTEIQKDYPNDNEPAPATLELASDVTRLLSSYLNSRWKDSPALFLRGRATGSPLRASGTRSRRSPKRQASSHTFSTALAASRAT